MFHRIREALKRNTQKFFSQNLVILTISEDAKLSFFVISKLGNISTSVNFFFQENIAINMKTCYDAGMENFIFEVRFSFSNFSFFFYQVVTDNAINLPAQPRVREVVVPSSYRTKSGAKFKARALQFCLEDEVNILQDNDWIVHLDEETLLTHNAVAQQPGRVTRESSRSAAS